MKKILGVAILAFVLSCTQKPHAPANCFKYKQGVFVMSFQGKTDTLIRSGDFQTEILKGIQMTFDVKWLDSCSYTLTPTQKTVNKYPQINREDVVTVQILKTTDSSYTQSVTSTANSRVITGEVYKVKSKSN